LKPLLTRRRFGALGAAALGLAALPFASAQVRLREPLVADMHSHYGMFLPRLFGLDLDRHMRENGVALLSWAVGVLLACESANFLEGQPGRLAQAHAMGVRHLQLVHYIHSPLGDHQTAEPEHGRLTPAGSQVVAECKRLGIVVDLAHGAPTLIDGALDASDAAMVWSHSWISPAGGTYQDAGYIARSLSLAMARKIAARGGAVGLWCLQLGRDPAYPVNNKTTYADEILRMCDLIGPEHVAFGTDMEGVWPGRMMNDYSDLRDVVDNLARRGLPEAMLHGILIGNYTRVVRQAMQAASAT
jgi:membrane dipeptidase